MRIAFTSCFDAVRDPVQSAWTTMAQQKPDHIVLLGDNIYMDYGLGEHLPNGTPRCKPLAEFSALMYGYYVRQWQVRNFQQAIRAATVHAIWDDHDFAWNNARGGDLVADDPSCVPPDRRRLSRALFAQYRRALTDKPPTYPANQFADGLVSGDLAGIQETIDLSDSLRLHLLDGRSFRERATRDFSLLGAPQRAQLGQDLLSGAGVNLIASGTTLKDWKKYSDYRWIRAQAEHCRLLVLSGDIHESDFRANGRLLEATASAMAQPSGFTSAFGKQSEVFGLLDIDSSDIVVSLWHPGEKEQEHVVKIDAWVSDV